MALDDATKNFIQAYHWLSTTWDVNTDPPTDYNERVEECKKILDTDQSGLITTTIEFILNAISEVHFKIETDNDELTKILNQWLKTINLDLRKQIPTGFNNFQREFSREFITSSMPVVRYNLGTVKGLLLPTKLWVLDSENVTVKEDKKGQLGSFDYSINDKPIRGEYLVRKDGRWYDKYPVPFLIRRGVYNNYILKKKLKQESFKILKKIVWALFMLKKGDPQNPDLVYTQTDLDNILTNLQTLLQDNKDSEYPEKIPAYATSYDTQIEQFLPDLTKVFNESLYKQIDRDILAGLGLVEIMEGVSTTRREAILNPKPLVQYTVDIIIEIEKLIYDLLFEIIVLNKKQHKKYFSDLNSIRVIATPLKAFWTEEFKLYVRSFYDRGLISSQTSLESIGFDFQTELKRREKELRNGVDIILYPPIIQNLERDETALEFLRQQEIDKEENITEDKESIEKENFTADKELEGAPYQTIKELPKNVKNSMSVELQRIWMRVFNNAWKTYKTYDDSLRETISIKTAWKVIRQIARKNKEGLWVRKKTRKGGKLQKVRLNRKNIERALDQTEKELIKEAIDVQQLEISDKKLELLNHLLKKTKKENN